MLKLNFVKKSFLIVIILSICFVGCGFASAQDINFNDTFQEVISDDIDLNSQSYMSEDNLRTGTFSEIMEKINNAQEGGVVVLDKDIYVGDGKDIAFSKSVTLQSSGNEKVILDGQNLNYIMFIGEEAKNTVIKNIEFRNGNSQGMGGAVISKADNVLFDNCIFHNNKATYGGGAIEVEGKYTTISTCEFYENEANGGGAVYTSYEGSKTGAGDHLMIINCNFHDNLAYSTAGALGIYGNHSEIRNSVFNSNKVYGRNGEVYGGAIQIGMDDHYIVSNCVGCIFINNSAITESEQSSHGGAGCIRNGIIFDSCKFVSNKADQGGALTYHSGGVIKNCTFDNNEAIKLYGGALSTGYNAFNMDLKIENSTFNGNDAPLGGGVFLIGENVLINNCLFDGNTVGQNGGAVYIKAETTTVRNSSFNKNIANVNGGAIYISATVSTIENNIFKENQAIPDPKLINDGLGGAIFIDSSQSNIKNNRFNLNVARNGSAIYISSKSNEAIIKNNTFSNNQAWVYQLEINGPRDSIMHGENALLTSTIHGGNNIGNFSNVFISNAIYNGATSNTIIIDGTLPVSGSTDSGKLYQDDKEYNVDIRLQIIHEDGTVVYSGTLKSDVYGTIGVNLPNLKPGIYTAIATHEEDTYYKAITNKTTFTVLPIVDTAIVKTSDSDVYNYHDTVEWNLTITNNGPDKATEVFVYDELPDSLIYVSDNGNGAYDFKKGVWNVGELDVGETKTLTIRTLINATGNVLNKASITSKEFDYNLDNNEDSHTISVNPAADLMVVKKVNNSNPNYGDLVTWTIEVTNNGPDTATGIIVTDILPEGLILIGSSGNYADGTWAIDKLLVGETKTIEIVCKINKTGNFTNIVTVKGNEYDFNEDNNKDNESIFVNPSADLAVVKTVDNLNPNYLDTITWTIEVINNGPDTATNVKVTDLLPEGLVIIDWNGEGKFENNVWDIGEMKIYDSKKLIIRTLVNRTGSMTNIVIVNGTEHDSNETNNIDNETVNVNPAADLAIVKNVNNSNPKYRDLIKWTITVTNNGPDLATEIIVRDILPEGLIYLKNEASTGYYDQDLGVWKITSLSSSDSEYIEIYCFVNKTGKITNIATVEGKEYDYDQTNNLDHDLITVEKTIDLQIDKIVDNPNPNYKEQIVWILTIRNNGPDDATGVVVVDSIPDGLIGISDNSGGKYNDGVWDVGILRSGESKELRIVCMVDKTGDIINVATITGNEVDFDLSNNNASASVNVKPAVDLSIIKTSSKLEYFVGDIIEYVITVKNNGPDTAHNVVISDYLDKGLEFISFYSNRGHFNEDGTQWMIDSLASGEYETLTFKALAKAIGKLSNKVSVFCDEFDYDLSNNNATAEIIVKDIVSNSQTPFSSLFKNESDPNMISDSKIVRGVQSMEKTGNPIAIFLLALVIFVPCYLRKL